MKDVMELLGATETSVMKYIKEKGLPSQKINHQYNFNKEELKEWVLKNGMAVSEKFLELNLIKTPVSIYNLVKKGGIIIGIEGDTPGEILTHAVAKMRISTGVKREDVLMSLIEREELMPTAVGRGIAIPHPRNPIISDIENESVTICTLNKPADYGAVDGKKVHTLFIVMSANSRRHLEILSKLLFLCQQETLVKMLEAGERPEAILTYIESKEIEIRERKS
jgi:PTS system nitrogen regulatory IIA component